MEKTFLFGWCEHHDDHISEETYQWKGCWGCHYFSKGHDFPYTFVNELAEEFKVSPQTVRRWVRTGKLEGLLFEQGRSTGSLPAPKKYHVLKSGITSIKKEGEYNLDKYEEERGRFKDGME